MREFWKKNQYVTLLLVVGAVYFFLQFLFPLIAPVLMAVVFVLLCHPILYFMKKKLHIKKQYIMAILLIFMALILGSLFWVLWSSFTKNLPFWICKIDTFEQEILHALHLCCETIEKYVGYDAVSIENMILDHVVIFFDEISIYKVQDFLGETFHYVKSVGTVLGFLLVMVISTILFAKDYDAIMNKMFQMEGVCVLWDVACEVLRYIGTFLRAQCVILLSIALVSGITLWILKVENGFLLGLLAGALDVLPFIGTGIVFLPLAIWEGIHGSYKTAIACLILYVVCALIRECLEPKLIGEKIGIYPIAIVLSVYAGIQLFGFLGVVKGPLGLVLIYHIMKAVKKNWDNKSEKTTQDNCENM